LSELRVHFNRRLSRDLKTIYGDKIIGICFALEHRLITAVIFILVFRVAQVSVQIPERYLCISRLGGRSGLLRPLMIIPSQNLDGQRLGLKQTALNRLGFVPLQLLILGEVVGELLTLLVQIIISTQLKCFVYLFFNILV
jgi:hypothetical protein